MVQLTFLRFLISNEQILVNIRMKRVLLLAVFLAWVLSANFTIHKHIDSSAKCLDGTPAALYYQIGRLANKFILYFQGGGLCLGDTLNATLQSCYKRSSTYLGSSSTYPDTRSFDDFGMISSNTSNPYHEWTRIYIPYCDGSVHQGSKKDAVSYKDKDLYFRGGTNTLTHFEFLDQKFNLFSAEKLIIVGTSAGGLAAFLWSNYIYQRAENPEGVLIIPDSGMFLSGFPGYLNKKTMNDYVINLITLVNTETPVPLKACVDKYSSQMECFQSGNLAEFIKPKMFIIQSQYDSWGLTNIAQMKCVLSGDPSDISKCNSTELEYIQKFRAVVNEGMSNLTSRPHIGAWTIACSQHVFIDKLAYVNSRTYKVPGTWGITIIDAITSFIEGKQKNHIDSIGWPFNFGCYSPQTNVFLNY